MLLLNLNGDHIESNGRPQKHFYRLQMALFGIFRLTLQKITIYNVYEAFFVYSLFGTLSGFL